MSRLLAAILSAVMFVATAVGVLAVIEATPSAATTYLVVLDMNGRHRWTISCEKNWDERQVCSHLAVGHSNITANGEPVRAHLVTVDGPDDSLPSGLTQRQINWLSALIVALSVGLTAYAWLRPQRSPNPPMTNTP